MSAGTFDAIVIGAGAAGLFCAGEAGLRGVRTLVLERNAEPGRKILISGGGRCNFTNLDCAADRFLSDNPHFAKSALARYGPRDFLALVEAAGIAWYEKTLGQLFCEGAGSARKIVSLLLDRCAAGGAEVRVGVSISTVTRAEAFRVETDQGAFTAPALVLASGGLSIPKLGASDFAHRLAAQFGLALTERAPALVPLTLAPADLAWTAPLAGVSAPAAVRAGTGPVFHEAALFTHRGLSGPAVLQASSYWRPGASLTLDLLPGEDGASLLAAKRARPGQILRNALAALLPQRLAEAAAGPHGARALGDLKDAALLETVARLRALAFLPAGDEGYAKAEVTRGGVDTRALSSKTMEARAVPGLFVIGEAADVTGWLGGYNFQWAWASGRAAAEALVERHAPAPSLHPLEKRAEGGVAE